MANNNTNRNRWNITLDEIVNFRQTLLEDKFTTVPEIRQNNPDDPKHDVFEIDLPGYGIIYVRASGNFTFKPFMLTSKGMVVDTNCLQTFTKRFFSAGSFQKVAEEFVNKFLSLQPVKKEQPKQEKKEAKKKGLPTGKVGNFDMETGKLVVDPEYKKKMEKQEQKKEGKKVHGKNEVGHILGTTADLIDKLFLQGVTEAELQEHGVTRTRYRSHFRHLQKKKAAFIEVKFEDGIYSAKLIG